MLHNQPFNVYTVLERVLMFYLRLRKPLSRPVVIVKLLWAFSDDNN